MAKRPKASPTTETEHKNGEQSELEVKPGAMVVREQEQMAQWTPRFAMTVDEAVELENQKQLYMQRVLKENVHYGMIPGAGKRKVLLKPGAEALCAAMGLHPELMDAEPPVRDYTGADHGGEPFWSFRRVCRIYRQTGPGPEDRMLVAQASGACNSFEVKYRYRQQERLCPVCNKNTVYRSKGKKDGSSKPEELGYFCWKAKGGCGANFRHNDPKITEQKVGRVANEDPFDLENTGLKMADKRALVAATLIATGFSTDFTQDLEDKVPEPDGAGYAESYGGGEESGGDDTQGSASADRPAASAPKASGSTQAPPAPPLTPEEEKARLHRQVAFALSGSIDPVWNKVEFEEARQVLGSDVRLLLGALVEFHMTQHGENCEHIKAIPSEVEYRYPHEEAHRAWIAKATARLKPTEAKGADVDPDEIPF